VRFLALTILLVCAPAFARIGEVQTVDGEIWQGHVRVTPGGVVVVNAPRARVFSVVASNIARLSFAPERPADATPSAVEGPPAGWRDADVGHAFLPGSARHVGGSITVRSSGVNIDREADSFHFVFKPVRGDSEIVAQLASIHHTHPYAKAGLMMREHLHEYSRNVMLALTAFGGGALQVRPAERQYTESLALPRVFAPQWLKLRRRGNEFSAFVSPNGRVWSLVQKMTLAMNENFYVGLAVASARDSVMNWTTFSRVREAPRLLNEGFAPEVELVSGSIIAGRPEFGDREEITFAGLPKVVRVPTSRVARIAFQPLSSELAWRTRVSRPGVFVNTGDFFDGDFRGLENGQLTISSVLYGLRTFDVEDEALALVLQPRKWPQTNYEIETADGSLLLGTNLTLGEGEVKLREPTLGEVRVPAFEIIELRRR